MSRARFFYPAAFIQIIAFFTLLSCNNNAGDIPFPEQDSANRQPVAKPLHFSGEKKLNWVTVKTGGLTPVIKHFDPDAIPAKTYDSTDYIPFTARPAQTHFDLNALPGAALNLDKLPDEPLQFKTSVLAPPVIVKAGKLTAKTGTPFSVFDIGASQGIDGKIVTKLLKDRKGFTWIATNQALYRYDGENAEAYLPSLSRLILGMAEDNKGRIWCMEGNKLLMLDLDNGTISESNKIPVISNNLSDFFVDSKGMIWVCNVANKGVDIIDPDAKTFKHLQAALGPFATFSAGEDKDKNIWLATTGKGLALINREEGKIKFITRSAGLAGDSVGVMALDKNGNVWAFVANRGLERINIKNGTITHYGKLQGLTGVFTLGMQIDKANRVWMGDGGDGFVIVDDEKGYTSHFRRANITNSFIVSLMADDKGRVWFGTNTGLNVLDNDAEVTHLMERANVSTMLEGPPGNIWIGYNGGIEILDLQTRHLRLLTKKEGLSDNNTQSFTLVDGNIWITSDAGLDIYNPTNKTMEHTGKKEGLGGDTIYTILKDNTGTLWLTGPSNGIDVIDAKKTSIKHAGIAEGLDDEALTDVKQDKQGLLWLATSSKGVDVVDPLKGTIRYLGDNAGLTGRFDRVLMGDSYGRMWIGTSDGVYVADVKGGTLTHITVKDGLQGNSINSMTEYNGSVLVSTNNKVSIVTMPPAPAGNDTAHTKWVIKPLYKGEGLIKTVSTFSSNLITSSGKYLWGDFGLTILKNIQPDTTQATTYVTGLQLMNQPQYFVNHPHLAQNDTLWTADSFYVRDQTPANAGFSGKYGLHWDRVAGPYNLPQNLNIPYNQNYIQFHFAEANLGRQDSAFYCYILQGIDKQWSAVTNNTVTENYLNLPPGTYTFKVRSKGLNGEWGAPASFNFTITPPWWKTWWAYTLYVLVVLAGISIIVKYRSQKLQAENILLEEKIKQRTAALQKSLEELKTTQAQLVQSEKMASLGELTAGIAHEIQNPLNFVNNFAEVSIELAEELKEELDKIIPAPANKEDINDLLDDLVQNQQKINFHGKRADSIVKGMLQHSRTGSAQKEMTDVNALADEYLRLSYHGLRAKDKSFNAKLETAFDEKLPKINILLQDVGRVLLNLYTNAFYSVMKKKHERDDTYQPMVSVSTQKKNNSIEIKVRDNGMGIPQTVLDKIYNPFFTTKPTGEGTGLGLSLSYEIITKGHGGTITVETKEGEFAEFTIRLPL